MKKIFLILLIIMFCTGCTSISTGGKTYQDVIMVIMVKKYVLANMFQKIQILINGMGGNYV